MSERNPCGSTWSGMRCDRMASLHKGSHMAILDTEPGVIYWIDDAPPTPPAWPPSAQPPHRPRRADVSRAVSAKYGVACPRCGVGADEPCRTMNGYGRVTDTHKPRIEVWLRRRWTARALYDAPLTPAQPPADHGDGSGAGGGSEGEGGK